MVSADSFRPGDCVRKFVSEWNLTPFVGVVTHIANAAAKVWVQWPIEHASESPETLIRVNPDIYGMPTAFVDRGYSSWEKTLSEQNYGKALPHRITPSRDLPPCANSRIMPRVFTGSEKMAIRIAHTFASDVVGRLVEDIGDCKDHNLTDVQAYNRIFAKYGSICSDYIIRSSIEKIFAGQIEEEDEADDAAWHGSYLDFGQPHGEEGKREKELICDAAEKQGLRVNIGKDGIEIEDEKKFTEFKKILDKLGFVVRQKKQMTYQGTPIMRTQESPHSVYRRGMVFVLRKSGNLDIEAKVYMKDYVW
jgi:hypothetical protein